jgi:hypothetical protein
MGMDDIRKGIKKVKIGQVVQMNLVMHPDLGARLQTEARRLKISRSEVVRRACELYLGMPLQVRGEPSPAPVAE